MRTTERYHDDRAVSSVIAVILMVAIAVILAAVIGTFVLGVGDQVKNSSPQVTFAFEKSGNGVTVTHEGGDTFDSDNVFIEGASDDGTPKPGGSWSDYNEGQKDVSSGDSVLVNDNGTGLTDGQTIQIVYKDPDSDKSFVIEEYTYEA
jgi:flagellin-like protein